MEYIETQISIVYLVVLLGSLIGSIKTSLYTNHNSSTLDKVLDILVGMFCGLLTGYHFAHSHGLLVAGLLALSGSATGAIIIESTVEILPKLVKEYLKKKLKD